jgi:LuxR family maltose regulon positive regulatory protein
LVAADSASYAVVRGDLTPAIEYAQRALAHLPPHDAIAKIRATSILGMAHFRAGDVSLAWEAFTEAIEVSETAGMPFATVPFLCNLVEILLVQGRLQQALDTCLRALQVGTVDGERTTPSGFVGLGLGKIFYERNDLAAAEKHLLEGLELLGQGGLYESFGNLNAVLAQVKQSQGDEASARERIQQAVQSASAGKIDRITLQASAYQARIWLSQGDSEAAGRWAQKYKEIGQTEYLREFEDLTLARVFLAQNRPAEALHLLDSHLPPAETAARMGHVIEIQALRALAFSASENLERALDALSHALRLAEPEGYIRTFIDEGPPMARLLRYATSQGITQAHIDGLLANFDDTGTPSRQSQAQSLIEPLSHRELEVLQLLAEGLTNPEIAHRLTIALPTVKSHTRNLYGKLGVGNRKEAVARALALGIIPPE